MSEENGPSASSGLRASDEDRERLIDELNEHAVAGRLSTEELEHRLGEAYSARTTAELEALRRDLPATARQAALSRAERRSHLTRRMIQEAGGSLAAFIVCTAIWVASGANGQFWPVWILIVVVLTFARSAWALFGPAPDFDAVESDLNARRQQRLEHDRHHPGRHDRRRERRDRRLDR